ncbi:MAG: hypothetical protein M3O36_04060, partial [Myxococcota bacterium]|nr:hypothetical protein [Myxococcota bacterium]
MPTEPTLHRPASPPPVVELDAAPESAAPRVRLGPPLDCEAKSKTAAARLFEWGLIAASYSVLFFERHWVGADGAMRFDALSSLLESGKMPTVKLSLMGPLFSAPLWYLGKRWLADPRLGCAYYNWVLFGI